MQGFTTAVTDIDTSPQEYLGAIRFDYNAAWKYVRFSGTLATAVGDVCSYVMTDQTMTTVDSTTSPVGAGVAPVAHPLGSVTYGWVQIRGVVTLSTAFGAGAVGNSLTTLAAANKAVTIPAAVTAVAVGFIVNVTAPIVMYAMFPD
jgi:hypothetical protein